MFGNNLDNKGMIFIIDFVLVVSIVIFVLIFFANVKQEPIIKTESDIVYLEANHFYGYNGTISINKTSEYLCNDFNVYRINNGLEIESKQVCVNVFK